VMGAYSQLNRVARSFSQVDVEGVLVTPMRAGGVELIAGVTIDPVFGPVLALGFGGVFVDVLDDVQLRVLPVQASDVVEMLESLRGSRLLHGVRGQPPVDRVAIAEVVTRLSAVAAGLGDDLETIEANPLWCRGEQVEVLDALVVMASCSPQQSSA
jgi:acetate---CoA ligase (ADP-forming)